MSDEGKSDQKIENEERFRVASEDTRGRIQEVRFQLYQRKLERRREVTETYHVDLERDQQLAARAGHSAQRRECDRENRKNAYRSAIEADEGLEFFILNRRGDE